MGRTDAGLVTEAGVVIPVPDFGCRLVVWGRGVVAGGVTGDGVVAGNGVVSGDAVDVPNEIVVGVGVVAGAGLVSGILGGAAAARVSSVRSSSSSACQR